MGGTTGAAVGESFERALNASGHTVARRVACVEGPHELQRLLREAIEDPAVDAIVLIGGTGLAKEDVTLETVEPFVEKPLPGFGEAMRALCGERFGAEGVLLRGEAFVSERKVVFCIPGSEPVASAVAEELIGRVLGSAVGEARG